MLTLIDTQDGRLLAGCIVTLDRSGLWLVWDDGCGERRAPLKDEEWVDAGNWVECPYDEYELKRLPPITPEVGKLYEEWSHNPDAWVQYEGCTVRAEVAPFLDLSADDPLEAFRRQFANNLLHDPNFHVGLEGASTEEREAIARRMAYGELQDVSTEEREAIARGMAELGEDY